MKDFTKIEWATRPLKIKQIDLPRAVAEVEAAGGLVAVLEWTSRWGDDRAVAVLTPLGMRRARAAGVGIGETYCGVCPSDGIIYYNRQCVPGYVGPIVADGMPCDVLADAEKFVADLRRRETHRTRLRITAIVGLGNIRHPDH